MLGPASPSLIELAGSGDSDAFAQLIAPHREELVRHAGRQLGERAHLSEDAVQEALVNAYRALVAGTRPENLRAWLFTIVHNCAVNIVRANRPTDPLPESSTCAGPDTHALLEQREWMDGLMSAIGALPDRQRQMLVGHTFEGRSYQELAERHSTTVPAVKTLLHRARRGLGEESPLRHALLAPWGLLTRRLSALRAHGQLAGNVGLKSLLVGSTSQVLGAATIASTVLLAVPATRAGVAVATVTYGHRPSVHIGVVMPRQHHRHPEDPIAAELRDADRAIESCERGRPIGPGHSLAALRYAAGELPTFARQYTTCESQIRGALRRTVANELRGR